MQYHRLPSTSLSLSTVSLGTMMFGGQTSEDQALSIMDHAFEHGVNVFDTANNYNGGESERIVGRGLRGRRAQVLLATKVGNPVGDGPNCQGLSRRAIRQALDDSLRRLGTEYVDLYYLHTPDPYTCLEESLETMSELVSQGKVHYIGVSNYAAWQIADICALCARYGFIAPVITQNVYNVLTRGLEPELLPFLQAHHMGLTVYNPLAGGLLTGKHHAGAPQKDTRFANNQMYYARYWSDENFTAVQQLSAIAEESGLSLLELALRWCMSHHTVTSVLCGVSRLSQWAQDLAVLDAGPLPLSVLSQCDQVWRSLAGTRFAYNR